MEKLKILFISQEITPYLPESDMSNIGRYLPQGIQEKGCEIRAFMPRYGLVNERRNQLHEVIRLSGMNLIIDDTDHPLIIKVASIQTARMQVYFIDNEDYLHRKAILTDKDGQAFDDNDERAVFFARGVIETVKKLRWSPDLVHCHGWITSFVPLFIKKAHKHDPLLGKSKIVTSLYNDNFEKEFDKTIKKKAKLEGVTDRDLALLNPPNYENVRKLAVKYSDAAIKGQENLSPEIEEFLKKAKKPILDYQTPEEYIDKYATFYEEIAKK